METLLDEGDEAKSRVKAEKPIAAAAAKPMNTDPDTWIVDTGSGLDLFGIQGVPPFETKHFFRDRNLLSCTPPTVSPA